MQHTVRGPITFDGHGLHSGQPARLTIRPAAAEHGIWFKRTDIRFGDALVPAMWDAVERSPLCTRLVNAAGNSVSTVEHVMAALAGCGVHNALIEIDGPEVPILDGSAVPFVTAILDKGLLMQTAPLRVLEILEAVQVHTATGWARLTPSDTPRMSFRIEFDDAAIGTQEKTLDLSNGSFVRELSDSRTFCRNSDVEAMRSQGLALGGTLENAVVVDGDQVLSPGGLRHADEAVRHKMLDALGDMMLAGVPILGHYEGHKAGHAITNMLLHALFSTPTAFRMVECSDDMRAKMPGVGILPEEIPEVA